MPDGRVGLIDLGQCVKFEPVVKLAFAHLVIGLAMPESKESDAIIVRSIQDMGVQSKNSNPAFIAFCCRFYLTGLRPERLNQEYFNHMMGLDSIVYQPVAAAMVTRVANLLRGVGLLVMENVDVAKAWSPYAQRWLSENGGSLDPDPSVPHAGSRDKLEAKVPA